VGVGVGEVGMGGRRGEGWGRGRVDGEEEGQGEGGPRTWGVVRLEHPVGVGGVGDDEVVPADLEVAGSLLEEGGAGEVGDV